MLFIFSNFIDNFVRGKFLKLSMEEFKVKRITKSQGYQFLATLIFGIAIFEVLNQKIGLGYVLILVGYCLLRKSDLLK